MTQGDSHRARLKSEGKMIVGPRRQGPHAATQAESDLQVLREANTSLATLEAAASALKSAAAASDTPAERNERSWKKLRTGDPINADESGVSQPASSSVFTRDFFDTGDGGGAQLLCSGSKREPSDAASSDYKKQQRETVSSASKSAPPPADPSSFNNRTASSDVHPAGRMRHGANEALPLDASTATSSTDDKINEGKRILNDLLASNPNNIDADWLRQMLG